MGSSLSRVACLNVTSGGRVLPRSRSAANSPSTLREAAPQKMERDVKEGSLPEVFFCSCFLFVLFLSLTQMELVMGSRNEEGLIRRVL